MQCSRIACLRALVTNFGGLLVRRLFRPEFPNRGCTYLLRDTPYVTNISRNTKFTFYLLLLRNVSLNVVGSTNSAARKRRGTVRKKLGTTSLGIFCVSHIKENRTYIKGFGFGGTAVFNFSSNLSEIIF